MNRPKCFFDAANREIFLLPRCVETGKIFFYPRDHSPFTGGEVEWVESRGEGLIYSYCISGPEGEEFCLAYIQLDDGPIILSNVHTQDFSKISIGQRVKVIFKVVNSSQQYPYFELQE